MIGCVIFASTDDGLRQLSGLLPVGRGGWRQDTACVGGCLVDTVPGRISGRLVERAEEAWALGSTIGSLGLRRSMGDDGDVPF